MPITISYDNKHFPKGKEFEIPGVGVIENGGKLTLSEDQERAYVRRNHKTVIEGLKDNSVYKVSGNSEIGNVEEVLGIHPDNISYAVSENPQQFNVDSVTRRALTVIRINEPAPEETVQEKATPVVDETQTEKEEVS